MKYLLHLNAAYFNFVLVISLNETENLCGLVPFVEVNGNQNHKSDYTWIHIMEIRQTFKTEKKLFYQICQYSSCIIHSQQTVMLTVVYISVKKNMELHRQNKPTPVRNENYKYS